MFLSFKFSEFLIHATWILLLSIGKPGYFPESCCHPVNNSHCYSEPLGTLFRLEVKRIRSLTWPQGLRVVQMCVPQFLCPCSREARATVPGPPAAVTQQQSGARHGLGIRLWMLSVLPRPPKSGATPQRGGLIKPLEVIAVTYASEARLQGLPWLFLSIFTYINVNLHPPPHPHSVLSKWSSLCFSLPGGCIGQYLAEHLPGGLGKCADVLTVFAGFLQKVCLIWIQRRSLTSIM